MLLAIIKPVLSVIQNRPIETFLQKYFQGNCNRLQLLVLKNRFLFQ
uniref:Uncharacterized protein n=1 Tax=Anguilla anguilla TaxID=7936 RepID=A0A0E9VZY2_ANGAN